MGETSQPKTSLGLKRNVESALSYSFGWITGILFFLLEKEDKTVRFHALQSIIVFGSITIIYIIFSVIPFIGWILGMLVFLSGLALWLVLMIKAYQGENFELPIVSDIAEKYARGEENQKK